MGHHKSRMQETTTQTSTFDEVLGLEEQFYEDGFRQGYEDGVKAGRVEGRTFGLEKGFEKYVESGRLHGKSIIWANRMTGHQKLLDNADGEPGRTHVQGSAESSAVQPSQPFSLHSMPDSSGLKARRRSSRGLWGRIKEMRQQSQVPKMVQVHEVLNTLTKPLRYISNSGNVQIINIITRRFCQV